MFGCGFALWDVGGLIWTRVVAGPVGLSRRNRSLGVRVFVVASPVRGAQAVPRSVELNLHHVRFPLEGPTWGRAYTKTLRSRCL